MPAFGISKRGRLRLLSPVFLYNFRLSDKQRKEVVQVSVSPGGRAKLDSVRAQQAAPLRFGQNWLHPGKGEAGAVPEQLCGKPSVQPQQVHHEFYD